MQFIYQTLIFYPLDRTLSDANTLGQSRPGSDSSKGLLHVPQSSSITKDSPSDCLVPKSGHLLGESYSSAEIQSVCSAAPADWASEHSLGESYPFAKMQLVYSARILIRRVLLFCREAVSVIYSPSQLGWLLIKLNLRKIKAFAIDAEYIANIYKDT